MQLKAIVVALACMACLGLSGPVLANAQLAEQKQCLQCHQVDRDTIGPSFRTIHAIYRQVKDPEAKLMAVIRDGSDANLGPLHGRARMPDGTERPPISEREARQLARWIMFDVDQP
jgi:cytochrome c